eukprot:TRINITY_DN1833_c0_g2_i3.p1 TRINITY_DN1833_c0_g2~~TRINITY_DN1833_c0_g2_i3.p1  ORF type:complete len:264 (+),score=72.68 TRINITY_DN1833_c0_g2_i3:81-872(+)
MAGLPPPAGPPLPGAAQPPTADSSLASYDPNAMKTVHILGIDPYVTEAEFARFLNGCGRITGAKICGDPRGRTLYGFVQYEDSQAAGHLVNMTGTKVGAAVVTTSFAKSSIRSLAMTPPDKSLFDELSHQPLLQSRCYCPVNDNQYISRKTGGKGVPPPITLHGRRGLLRTQQQQSENAYAPYGQQQSNYQQAVARMYQQAGYGGKVGLSDGSDDGSDDHRRRKKDKKSKKEKKEKEAEPVVEAPAKKEKKEKKRRRRGSSSD